tara:strand:- start:85 stop:753 length:669 start_codon:yes stop_codon:yes gene_type:complete
MKRITYTLGQVINKHNITYVSETNPINTHKTKRRSCIFKCECGKEFTCTLSDVRENKRTSCGCKKGNRPNIYKEGDLINGIKFMRTCGTYNYAQRAIFECPICKDEWESSIGNVQSGHTRSCCGVKRGWSRSQWLKVSKIAKLYRVRLYNNEESFIKIGITTQSLERRFKSIPYDFEVLKIIEGESGYIFDLELRTKRFFRAYRYVPLLNFKGETECYIIKN